MKKIVLLLIFFCTISFSNTIGGFGDLKWGASREEVKKYLMETYNLKDYSIFQINDYTEIIYESIKFENVSLWKINFYYNKKGQFSQWRAESYTMKGDKLYLIDKYKKAYNLKEKRESDDIVSLTGYPESEGILIQIYPDKVTYYIENFDYSLADF